MRERSGASVLMVLREGQALANPEPGLVLRVVHQSTAPFTGAVIRSTPNGLIPTDTRFKPVQPLSLRVTPQHLLRGHSTL
jgi:hypothetical protein